MTVRCCFLFKQLVGWLVLLWGHHHDIIIVNRNHNNDSRQQVVAFVAAVAVAGAKPRPKPKTTSTSTKPKSSASVRQYQYQSGQQPYRSRSSKLRELLLQNAAAAANKNKDSNGNNNNPKQQQQQQQLEEAILATKVAPPLVCRQPVAIFQDVVGGGESMEFLFFGRIIREQQEGPDGLIDVSVIGSHWRVKPSQLESKFVTEFHLRWQRKQYYRALVGWYLLGVYSTSILLQYCIRKSIPPCEQMKVILFNVYYYILIFLKKFYPDLYLIFQIFIYIQFCWNLNLFQLFLHSGI